MALEPARFGRPLLANVLPFSKPSVPPTFTGARSLPPIQAPAHLTLEKSRFDLFQASSPADKTLRVVVRPENALYQELKAALVPDKNLTQAEAAPQQLMQRLETAANILSSALTGQAILPNGSAFATYKPQTFRPDPAMSPEARQAKAAEVSAANHATLLEAITRKLSDLPKGTKNIVIDLPKRLPTGVNQAELLRDLAEHVTLQGYNRNFHRQANGPLPNLPKISISKDGQAPQGGLKALSEGQVVGSAMNLARHFVDSPANFKTTRYIADTASKLTSPTLDVQVLEPTDLEGKTTRNNKRMGLLLGVGAGNDKSDPNRDPRLVEMVYTPKDWDPATGKTLLMVGKGIIFDTGGNNLKPSEYIHNMEGDMAGAAAVISTMKALDDAQLSGIRVVGLAPLTENRLGSGATLPNDIHLSRAGKTVQVSNTDAEGRLILADALHYGLEKYRPDTVADIATLTGGKARGVGEQNAVAISGNNLSLMKQVDALERKMSRKTAVLPLNERHQAWVTRAGKGKADVFNSVSMADARLHGVLGPYSGPNDSMLQHSAQGAAFLREFFPSGQDKTPWVHYDIAGAEFDKPDPKSGNETWATGFGVKELYFLAKGLADGNLTADPKETAALKSR